MSNLFDMTDLWNNAAVTFTGLKLNVTDTASAGGSMLMDLQVGGVSKASVAKDGTFSAQGTIISASHLRTTGGGSVQINSNTGALSFGSTADLFLYRDAANTLALRNGTAAQKFNVYNTYTDASNYETLQIGASLAGLGANTFGVVAKGAGTGSTTRPIYFGTLGAGQVGWVTSGITRWLMDASGNLTANADNAYDIGASGANRPRDFFLGRNANIGGTITAAATGYYGFSTRSLILSPADGTTRLSNWGGTITTDITLSGASTAGASLATFGGAIAASKITTSDTVFLHNTSASLANGAAAQIATMTNGPTAGNPTKWIAINDNGTTRYIPAW